ncbi:Npun_R2821/Npun_R2822 family protein [Coleofasciculus chthonoplastes]|uniref:Npun_R2821/Npun_R2822 family protein n=1 Tax=Coleofasciculus chthonoplastes TaxID=64178 RepID=UPI0032F9F295
MSSFGIYTLANDAVYDQLVALLNSIEVNVSPDIPVCVIPYDERLERVKPEVDSRANVTLFDNRESIQRWEDFATQVWAAYPAAKKKAITRPPWGKGHYRRFAAFDGQFERFVFYDADSLAMKSVEDVLEKLDAYDFVFDDWEHKKSIDSAALDIPLIEGSGIYKEEQIRPKLHCSSFFGSKQGIFDERELSLLKEQLIEREEIAWLSRWWDDAFLFNYMTLRCDRPLYNFTLSPNGQDRTGNCADADPFVNIDQVLYNEQGLKPIHRIHYMNYSSKDFAKLCKGEDVDIRYKDIFLYYRFMKQPDQKPKQIKSPSLFVKTNRHLQNFVQKVKKISVS